MYEPVLAAHKLQLLLSVYFYYRAVPIAEHSGLIYLCKYTALFPARATKSRLAEHHVHWRLLFWCWCMSETEEFELVHNKL